LEAKQTLGKRVIRAAKGALKTYRRMRSRRRAVMAIFAIGVMFATGPLDLSRTDALICYVGVFGLWTARELEMRLKTMQIRLAQMSDRLRKYGIQVCFRCSNHHGNPSRETWFRLPTPGFAKGG